MTRVIGVSGFISSGKDTVANYLVAKHGFVRDSFAGALKDAVSHIFGWDRSLLEGLTPEAREWRETVDQWWSNRLNIPNLTPRWVLQQWGTEVCRHSFHDDIWIASLQNRLRLSGRDVVISDVRFPNEIKAIKEVGGTVIWVRRGELPVWYNCAKHENEMRDIGKHLMDNPDTLMKVKYPNVHPSEWAWIGTDFDHVLDNDGTVEQLYEKIKSLL